MRGATSTPLDAIGPRRLASHALLDAADPLLLDSGGEEAGGDASAAAGKPASRRSTAAEQPARKSGRRPGSSVTPARTAVSDDGPTQLPPAASAWGSRPGLRHARDIAGLLDVPDSGGAGGSSNRPLSVVLFDGSTGEMPAGPDAPRRPLSVDRQESAGGGQQDPWAMSSPNDLARALFDAFAATRNFQLMRQAVDAFVAEQRQAAEVAVQMACGWTLASRTRWHAACATFSWAWWSTRARWSRTRSARAVALSPATPARPERSLGAAPQTALPAPSQRRRRLCAPRLAARGRAAVPLATRTGRMLGALAVRQAVQGQQAHPVGGKISTGGAARQPALVAQARQPLAPPPCTEPRLQRRGACKRRRAPASNAA
jgi:hypothetical protein